MNSRLASVLTGLLLALGCGRTVVVEPIANGDPHLSVAADPVGVPFEFGHDAAGALAAKTLMPARPEQALPDPELPPAPFAAPPVVAPDAPVSPARATMPEVPVAAVARELRPHLVTPETALSAAEELSLPQAAFFPAPAPVRLGGADSELHLPPLATQRADRAPLTDPAGGAAWNAVVGLGLPARLQAAAAVLEPVRQAARRRAAGRLSQVLAENKEAVAASSAPYARLDK